VQLREVRLVGQGKLPASVDFRAGGNVVSGDSNTGKSYILKLIDFVFGADEMTKVIEEAEGYDTAYVQLENKKHEHLTLARHLSGGDIKVFRTPIDDATGDGEVVLSRRHGTSEAPDVTSVLFSFANIKEARLRRDAKGQTSRLSVRVLIPFFVVGEHEMIDERSPAYGSSGFSNTANKRALSYLLTGGDDEGIIAAEAVDAANAQVNAKLALVSDLLKPVDDRLAASGSASDQENLATIERADNTIQSLSNSLAESQKERESLRAERGETLRLIQSTETQTIALEELLSRYRLLNTRYNSDLERLDFVAEGSHFLNQLQEARCPLCDQPMDAEHKEHFESSSNNVVYRAARAEAAKIKGLRDDLKDTISTLEARLKERREEHKSAQNRLRDIDRRMELDLAPSLRASKEQLDLLFERRLQLEGFKSDFEQAEEYRNLIAELQGSIQKSTAASKNWAPIDPIATRKFCGEVELLLREWGWKDDVRVEFDDKKFDIRVDGKPRASHGKGYGALLHAAFVIGLLRTCVRSGKPHPGLVIMDSPITTFKEGRAGVGASDQIDPSTEAAFWRSLGNTKEDIQVIVIDNKEPPKAVIDTIHYHYFAGKFAKLGERAGFIPPKS
jgi:hypothetical protein